MRDALMIELAFCLHNDLTVSETTGRVCAVIAAAMAADKAEIARLRELVHPLVDAASRFNGVYACRDRLAAPFQGKMMLALQAINREMPSLFEARQALEAPHAG